MLSHILLPVDVRVFGRAIGLVLCHQDGLCAFLQGRELLPTAAERVGIYRQVASYMKVRAGMPVCSWATA